MDILTPSELKCKYMSIIAGENLESAHTLFSPLSFTCKCTSVLFNEPKLCMPSGFVTKILREFLISPTCQ